MKIPAPVRFVFAAAVLTASAASAPASLLPVRQLADLKSFFHGAAGQPPKLPPPPVTAVVSTAAGLAPDRQVEDFFRAYATALRARDGSAMAPYLAPDYTVADLPPNLEAADFFAQAVDRAAGPEAIIIQSVEAQGPRRLVKVEFKYSAKTKIKTFQFDAAGKLLSSDLFTLKRVEHSL